jgi:hypothetical protein
MLHLPDQMDEAALSGGGDRQIDFAAGISRTKNN